MYGAFIGDIVGSYYEFANTNKKDFPLFNPLNHFTDDSVMTLAVMDLAVHQQLQDPKAIVDTFRKWGKRYPDAGYGGRFKHWLLDQNDYATNDSYGNGAAMRISPVGWYADKREDVALLSNAVTQVSHSHPEGLKGAEVVASCIYYAREYQAKEYIKWYALGRYKLFSSYKALQASNKEGHGPEICQVTVPQAISAFLLSKSFEDCLRIAISIGGDSDTIAAIACSIAEPFYREVDPKLKQMVLDQFKDDKEALDLLTNKDYAAIFHDPR
jgi:ADP-ribosylglycohydrolase